MAITPLDIQQQNFKNKLFGYDPASVDQFLEQIADQMEQQMHRINELTEELARNRQRISEFESREQVLNETMLTAQKVAAEMREGASREAELILAEARLEGDRLLREADQRRLRISEEIQELNRQKITFQSGLRSLVEGHLKMLDLDIVDMPDLVRRASLPESASLPPEESTSGDVEDSRGEAGEGEDWSL